MKSQHIELSDSDSNRDKGNDSLLHGVLINKPYQERPKTNYKDTTTLINHHKMFPGWEVILKNFEEDIFSDFLSLRQLQKRRYMIKCISTSRSPSFIQLPLDLSFSPVLKLLNGLSITQILKKGSLKIVLCKLFRISCQTLLCGTSNCSRIQSEYQPTNSLNVFMKNLMSRNFWQPGGPKIKGVTKGKMGFILCQV